MQHSRHITYLHPIPNTLDGRGNVQVMDWRGRPRTIRYAYMPLHLQVKYELGKFTENTWDASLYGESAVLEEDEEAVEVGGRWIKRSDFKDTVTFEKAAYIPMGCSVELSALPGMRFSVDTYKRVEWVKKLFFGVADEEHQTRMQLLAAKDKSIAIAFRDNSSEWMTDAFLNPIIDRINSNDTLTFPTFFITKTENGVQVISGGRRVVEKRLKRRGIGSIRQVLIPFNETVGGGSAPNHWALFCFIPETGCLHTFGRRNQHESDIEKKLEETLKSYYPEPWTIVHHDTKQGDLHSCGVILCWYAMAAAEGAVRSLDFAYYQIAKFCVLGGGISRGRRWILKNLQNNKSYTQYLQ